MPLSSVDNFVFMWFEHLSGLCVKPLVLMWFGHHVVVKYNRPPIKTDNFVFMWFEHLLVVQTRFVRESMFMVYAVNLWCSCDLGIMLLSSVIGCLLGLTTSCSCGLNTYTLCKHI